MILNITYLLDKNTFCIYSKYETKKDNDNSLYCGLTTNAFSEEEYILKTLVGLF